MKTRIIVVDDHDVVRRGVVSLLASRSEWEVCAECRSGREAVTAAARLKPDVVIMDLSMPEMNGVEATEQILKDNPNVQVLILTVHESETFVRRALATGARGYLLKKDAGADLLAAVEAVRQHRPYFTKCVAESMMRRYLEGRDADDGAPAELLTAREREIVQLVAEGKSSKEIASILRITAKTVDTHRAHIMTKLELHSIPDLVRYAIRNRIIEC